MILRDCLIALVSGALVEGTSVIWVHYSERGNAAKTAMCSAVIATAQVLGIGESIRDARVAVLFVLGYSAGTYLAVAVKRRWLSREPSSGAA